MILDWPYVAQKPGESKGAALHQTQPVSEEVNLYWLGKRVAQSEKGSTRVNGAKMSTSPRVGKNPAIPTSKESNIAWTVQRRDSMVFADRPPQLILQPKSATRFSL